MTSRAATRWCASYFALLVIALISFAGVNYWCDFYGLFGTRDHVRLYSNERTGKFLLGLRYIPEHFRGILIGSSISENWDLSVVSGLAVYNASLSGGNITEESLIADNAFQRGHIALAIFCIHPYLTATHGRKSAYMNEREYWGALGSIPLLREYAGAASLARSGGAPLADENGVSHFEQNAVLARPPDHGAAPVREIEVDEQAFEEYARLVRRARNAGARIVAFIPPVFAPKYREERKVYERYVSRIRSLFLANELIVDFNGPEYARLTEDPASFYDGTHLSAQAAAYFSQTLADKIASDLASAGSPPPAARGP